jgi:hypothetical protein
MPFYDLFTPSVHNISVPFPFSKIKLLKICNFVEKSSSIYAIKYVHYKLYFKTDLVILIVS